MSKQVSNVDPEEGEGLRILKVDETPPDKWFKRQIEYTIQQATHSNKEKMELAYQIRNGDFSESNFEYLTAQFGMEFPGKVRHVPVLKSMFDRLVGEAQLMPLKYQMTCRNTRGLKQVEKEREENKKALFEEQHRQQFEENLSALKNGGQPLNYITRDTWGRLKKQSKKFKTSLEIASQDMLEYFLQFYKIGDVKGVWAEDVLTAAGAFYQVKVEELGQAPIFQTLNPLGVHFPRIENRMFMREYERAYYEEEMTPLEVVNRHGHKMTKGQLQRFIREYRLTLGKSEGMVNALEAWGTEKPNSIGGDIQLETCKVCYAEWKALVEIEDKRWVVNKKGKRVRETYCYYREDLFEGYRAGEDFYFGWKKALHQPRPHTDKRRVNLTLNGMAYMDRNGDPYSLVLSTKEISEKIDVLHYHAENLIAMSGVKALLVRYKDIPKWMGDNPMERIGKFLGFLRQGAGIIDPGDDGFNHYTDLNLSVDQGIKVIWEFIQVLEDTASRITGVNRQSVGDITQNDGLGTAKMAVQASAVTIQPIFNVLRTVMREAINDLMNAGRVAYEDGFEGMYQLPDGTQQLFKVNSKTMDLAEMDIHLDDTGEEKQRLEEFRMFSKELVAGGQLKALNFLDVFDSRSLAELRQRLDAALEEEQPNVQQLQEELEQFKQAYEEAQKKLEEASYKQAELGLKQQELQQKGVHDQEDLAIKRKQASDADKFNQDKLEIEKKRLALEAAEVTQGKGNQKEVSNK